MERNQLKSGGYRILKFKNNEDFLFKKFKNNEDFLLKKLKNMYRHLVRKEHFWMVLRIMLAILLVLLSIYQLGSGSISKGTPEHRTGHRL